MVVSLSNIPKESLVYHFITSGKPGKCQLPSHKGLRLVDKLEAHHISYDPEITIKLCHNCHHKVHFWPQRLTDLDKLKILSKKFPPLQAQKIISEKILGPAALAKIVAPSRKSFILRERQNLEKAPVQVKRKVNKGVDLSFLKRIKASKPDKAC